MLHTITPLHKLNRQAVENLAKAAAERGDRLEDANVFEPGSDQRRQFRTAYLKHDYALAPAD